MNLSQASYDALVNEIYSTLINVKTYDPDTNTEIEMGMGEMGEAHDEAQRIVDKWMKDQNIELVEETINS